ncbi:ornithine cyclodeaminase family protein [Acidimangrovimonas pyrenivorans]|uniref:Ornithine cyclodeaminase family protein n=1 Tax=Acidimangrovimonas pyrenivorans TaxID=2030798 RepID=A0ABV7ACS6_9RHOB
MTIEIIGPEAEKRLSWDGLTEALLAGHKLPPAQVEDTLLTRGGDKLLSRAAWIDGMGLAVKSATIFPANAGLGLPSVNGSVSLFSDTSGELEALVDFHLVTKWKTAGDSLLAAKLLARPDSRFFLIVGAGAVARSMIEAYRSAFPAAQFLLWNRTFSKAAEMAAEIPGVSSVRDLEGAVRSADVICTATMSTAPIIHGSWIKKGTHLDLIGAYTPEMREVDDKTLQRARIFVDSRATTMGHIGELKIPIEEGVIDRTEVLADFYDIERGKFARRDADEITLSKNGGGAHLDLMTARYILEAARRK